jgi:glutathione S-transferase
MASYFDISDSFKFYIKLLGGAATALLINYVVRRMRHRKKTEYPPDVVVLHQVGRGPNAPSFSPFALKMETFLRMTKVPYMNVHDKKLGPKGKFPWIEYNGKVLPDTYFCIEFLNKKYDLDLDGQLTPSERATSRAFQKMMEENTFFALALERFIYDTERLSLDMAVSWYIGHWVLPRIYKKKAYYQGMGRHTQDEVMAIMDADLKAFSDFLGDKRFFMGDNPTEADCSIFGFLAQVKWVSSRTVRTLVVDKYSNLSGYCDRVRELYWPDWDECTTRGGTQNATQ